MSLDLRGLVPAPVTPFTADMEVDHDAVANLTRWLASVPGVKGTMRRSGAWAAAPCGAWACTAPQAAAQARAAAARRMSFFMAGGLRLAC